MAVNAGTVEAAAALEFPFHFVADCEVAADH